MAGLFRKATMRALLCSAGAASVFLAIVVLAGGCGGNREAARVTVLTYNIYHGEDAGGGSNLDAVAGIINAVRPDLVALQEVDVKTTRVKGLDLTAELSARTGMEGRFGKAMDYAGGGYGVAVLSRLAIVGTANHPLPHGAGVEPRTALEVEVRLPGGEQAAFVCTHLDHKRDAKDRLAQAAAVRELFAGTDKPVILAGDFNATPDSETMALFAPEWQWAGRKDPQPTFPAEAPNRTIDYILVKPGGRWRVVESRVIEEKAASDHRPVLAVLELLGESED